MTGRTPLLTVDQVAERLAIPAWSVRKLIRRGALSAHDLGDGRPQYRISEQQLATYLDGHLANTA